MWKYSLPARFTAKHQRRESQTPLIPSKGSRPISTGSLGPIQEYDLSVGRSCDTAPCTSADGPTAVATTTNSQLVNTVTATVTPHEKANPIVPNYASTRSKESRDIESNHLAMRSLRAFMMEEIDTAQASAPLSVYCFMTGFIDAVAFSAIFVWCAFQTGNNIQLSLALARLFNGQHDYSFHIADQQALCSLLCFILGAFIGRVGDKIGCKTRMWMTMGTFIQTVFTMAAAITIWQSHSGSVASDRGNPAWSNTLSFVTIGFISASMGLQGIMGKRLNTQFTTTVVLTTTWCEFLTEPQLFNLRRLVVSRDHKALAIIFLFMGGFIGRALVDKIGSAGTLGVGTGLRFVITLWWLLVPAKKTKQ